MVPKVDLNHTSVHHYAPERSASANLPPLGSAMFGYNRYCNTRLLYQPWSLPG